MEQLQSYQHLHHGCARRRKERAGIGNLFEKNNEKKNFLNLVYEIDTQVQKVQKVPNKMNSKRSTPRHIIIKMPKFTDKERILKAAREKQLVNYYYMIC